ncbi:MAG: ABC transporter permease [Actinomycetota bacterium]|nr:ABC transporter permease [Actinomycetota bacterium]
MFAYAVRRLLSTIPLLALGTFIVFWGVSAIGDPLARLATCTTCDESAYQRLIDLYELDKSVPERYVSWIGDVLTGDFGTSTSLGESPVSGIIWDRFGNTLLLAVPAFLLIAVLAISISVFSAIRQYSLGDYAITGLSFLGISMPTFFVAILLQVFWGQYFPDWTGMKPFFVHGKHDDTLLELLGSMTLPVITLMAVVTATESRFGRSSMLEVINADYIRTARAKGLSERRVVFRHALRNALIPLVTIWALDFAALLSGSVVTETVFSWPGLGPLLVSSIEAQDLDLIMAIVLLIAVLVVMFNLIADLLYGVLDPRIRYG